MRDLVSSMMIACLLALPAAAEDVPEQGPDGLPEPEPGLVIGDVILDKKDIFDLSNPDEDRWLYRVANRLHVDTRPSAIRNQLLFRSGDVYDKRKVEESERILRKNKFLYDASIEAVKTDSGTVDLHVVTRDVWSLQPELSVSRKGGKTRTRFGIEENNLLGRGQRLKFLRDNDYDRSENTFTFEDRNLGRSWVWLRTDYSDNSDGSRSSLSVIRPFYALDARWAAGGLGLRDDRRTPMYQFGEEAAEYRHERDYFFLFGGLSKGLVSGRARRWTAGVVYDDNRYSEVDVPSLPALVPGNRKLVYPFVGFELVEDGFTTTRNQDQIGRTEDFQMGLVLRASLGWSDTTLGADRNAAIFAAVASRGFGSLQGDALFLAATTSGRVESGDFANAMLSINGRYYSRQSKKRTFFAQLSGTYGSALDIDNPVEIGGKTGLRGYPLRYQVGDSKALATIEQRYYTDWYPWRFARVGGAIFADVGRVWGRNPLGDDNRGWLADVGFGLRLALTRLSAGRIVHIDLAFPLNNDPDIDSVQLLIELRQGF